MSTDTRSISEPIADAALRRERPLRDMIVLAAPTVATMTSYTLMQFVDAVMVSRIGPDPVYVGAHGNGGLAAWVPISVVYGLLLVVNTYVSQNLGAGTPARASAYAWTGLWMALGASVLLVPYGMALPTLFDQLGHSPRQVALETSYAQVLIFGAFFTIASRALSQYFYGLHRPMVVLVAGLAGNLTNLFFNWVFIFGNLGAPALGVQGAAIATVIGTAVELAIPLAVFLGPTLNRLHATRAAWRPSGKHLRDILRLGWPGALMMGNEMACWAFFMVYLVGLFGEVHATAGWIAHRWMSLSFMPAVGISVAVTAMVGKCMGAGRPDLAVRRAWAGVGLTMVYMGCCAVAFVAFREPMVRVFVDSGTAPEDMAKVVKIGATFLILTAAFQLFDALALTISGALRGAGDTVWPGVVTVVLSWAIIVGGGLAMTRFFPQAESAGPWGAAAAYIIVLSLFFLWRFLSGHWKSIKLLQDSATAPPNESASQRA